MGEVRHFPTRRAQLLQQAYARGFTAGQQTGYSEGFLDALKLLEERAQNMAELPEAVADIYEALAGDDEGPLSHLIRKLLGRCKT